MHILLVHRLNKQTNGGDHHHGVGSLDGDDHIVELLALEDTQELHATLNDTLGGITIARHDTVGKRTVVHTDTHGRMMLLTDIQEGHQLALDLLQFLGIFLIGVLEMLERATWIHIVTRIDTHLLTIEGCDICRMGREMNIGHERCLITVGLQLSRDVLHVLCLTNTLGGETYEFATSVDDTFGLSHTTFCVICIYRSHRLDADGILSANADTTDTGLCGLSSLVHLIGFKLVLNLCQLLIGFLNLYTQVSLIGSQTLSQIGIGKGHHLNSEDSRILSAIDTDSSHRDTRGHLDDREHGVKAIEHTLDGNSDNWQGGRGGDDTWQGCSHTGTGYNHLDTTILGSTGKRLYGIGRAMGRKGIYFKRHLQLIEQLAGFLHNGQVTGAAHDDTY